MDSNIFSEKVEITKSRHYGAGLGRGGGDVGPPGPCDLRVSMVLLLSPCCLVLGAWSLVSGPWSLVLAVRPLHLEGQDAKKLVYVIICILHVCM